MSGRGSELRRRRCAGPAKLRANGAGVVVLPGVPPAGLFARMSERAVGSVVAPAPVAPPDFELEQPEVLRRVGVVVGVVGAVVGEEFPEKGFVGEHVAGAVVVVDGCGMAGEEVPGREEKVVVDVIKELLIFRCGHCYDLL